MTDYLELAVREDADALWEAERRLALLRTPFLAEKTTERGRPGEPEEQERPEEQKGPEGPKRAEKAWEGRLAVPSHAKSSAGALLLEQLWRREAPVQGETGGETAPGPDPVPDLNQALFPGGDREDPWSAFAAWDREGPEEGRSALLDQLKQAERAAETGRVPDGPAAGHSPEGRAGARSPRPPERGSPLQPDGPGGGWTGAPGRETARQEGEDLARQIDRAFQRDARRYDGGFFLY